MVAMTVREIAEKVKAYEFTESTDLFRLDELFDIKDIAFLLNAVVKERQSRLIFEFAVVRFKKRHPRFKWTEKDFHYEALRELDLDKVWPMKER